MSSTFDPSDPILSAVFTVSKLTPTGFRKNYHLIFHNLKGMGASEAGFGEMVGVSRNGDVILRHGLDGFH